MMVVVAEMVLPLLALASFVGGKETKNEGLATASVSLDDATSSAASNSSIKRKQCFGKRRDRRSDCSLELDEASNQPNCVAPDFVIAEAVAVPGSRCRQQCRRTKTFSKDNALQYSLKRRQNERSFELGAWPAGGSQVIRAWPYQTTQLKAE